MPRSTLGQTTNTVHAVPAAADGLSGTGPGYMRHMTDPRNIAHDKKVASDKAAHGEELAPGAEDTPQPGKKPRMDHHAGDETAKGSDPTDSDGGA